MSRVHQGNFVIFRAMMQELLIIEQVFSKKIQQNKKLKIVGKQV
jgi:hypothetical protein